MPRRSPVPLDLLARPFTVAEALARKVPQPVLDGPRFRRPHRGIRVPRELPDSPVVRAVSASLALDGRAVLSGWTVVVLLGLPTPLHDRDPLRGRVTARVPEGVVVPQVAGVDCGTGAHPDRFLVLTRGVRQYLRPGQRGLRIQRPEDAWCDVATSTPFPDAVALGDAVRRHWADDAQIAAAVAARDRTRGVVALREVAAAVRWQVDSAMETRARLLYVAAGLPEPECGFHVWQRGHHLGQVDLCWPRWRIVVEYEGDGHRTGVFGVDAVQRVDDERARREQWQRDHAKRRTLRDAGWTVIEITGTSITRSREATVEEVRAALRSAGAPV